MSAMNTVATLHRVDQSVYNVAEEMDKVVGSLDDIVLRGQDILVGVFVRPSKTKIIGAGGKPFIMHTGGTGKEAVEDVYQGKIVRILKLGPQAFCPKTFPELAAEWGDAPMPKVGDWVFCRATDGIQCSYKGSGSLPTEMFEDMAKMPSNGGWPCRIIAFGDVIGRVSDPAVFV
jgi:hypothetical protein